MPWLQMLVANKDVGDEEGMRIDYIFGRCSQERYFLFSVRLTEGNQYVTPSLKYSREEVRGQQMCPLKSKSYA